MNAPLIALGLVGTLLAFMGRRAGASSPGSSASTRRGQSPAPAMRAWCDRGPASLTDANMADAAGMAGWVACTGRSFADVSLVLARMDALVARGGANAGRIAAARSAVREAWRATSGELEAPEVDEGDEFPAV